MMGVLKCNSEKSGKGEGKQGESLPPDYFTSLNSFKVQELG